EERSPKSVVVNFGAKARNAAARVRGAQVTGASRKEQGWKVGRARMRDPDSRCEICYGSEQRKTRRCSFCCLDEIRAIRLNPQPKKRRLAPHQALTRRDTT